MTYRMLVASLLVATLGQTDALAEAPGAVARERGLAALQESDYLAAAAEFQEAAGEGDAVSMRHLGDMAFAGTGVAQNFGQAIQWYCQAALAADRESVDRLENIGLTSWATRRDAQGWDAACKQWLAPSPPPAEPQTGPPSPEVNIKIVVQPERERSTPSAIWPGYYPWHWRRMDPRHPPPKPVHPREPAYMPGRIGR